MAGSERCVLGPDEIYKDIGSRIRAARLERGLSQAALAEGVGLARTSITNVERGRQRIQVHTLIDIASALDADPRSLLPDRPEQLADLTSLLDSGALPEESDALRRMLRR